eukprot:gene185-186_t
MNHDKNVTTTIGHLIDGQIVADTARTQPVFDPATGLSTTSVALASQATVEAAIASAEAAFPAWRNTPPLKRARVMSKLKVLLEENADKIATLITAEHGKVLADAHGELQRGIENVEYASYAPELLKGEHSRNRDPSSTLFIAQLALEAGLPPGVLNVVNGDKLAVDTLLQDPRVKAVSFVGSTPIAEYIYSEGCKHGKRVQALGGAKNHAVLMPDADVGNAVSALMGAAYGSCGERCMAIPLLVAVGDEVGDAVIAGLKTEIAKMKVGPGTDNSNDMGPLVTKPHFEKVKAYVDSGVAEGATLVVDGRGVKVAAGHENGYFLGACLFDNVKPGMKIYQEEIFGPVLGVVRVKTLQEAMQLINDHEYGNGTCIFTRDGEAARYFTDHIQVGMVGVNVPLPVPVAYHSFGGWKRSLFGDLHAYGPDAVRFYTKRKTITQRWPSAGVREGAVFSFPSSR